MDWEVTVKTVHAVYENGVFRPVGSVELPEKCEVEFEPRIVNGNPTKPELGEIYELLGNRFDSGQADVAEKHDDHQP